MPSLVIPEEGLSFNASRDSSQHAHPMAIGLALADNVIEDMIRCFQENKPIHLSLGEAPKIQYGTKTQHFGTIEDPFVHELYRNPLSPESTSDDEEEEEEFDDDDKMQRSKPSFESIFCAKKLQPRARPLPTTQVATATSKTTAATTTTTTTPQDAALAALQGALASENAKKAGNTIKYIKDGTLPLPGKRGAKAPAKPKFLSSNRAISSDTTRSMPSSPALSGVGSPALGPTSVPLSQQQAEQAKAVRRPIIHYLALHPHSASDIMKKVGGKKEEVRLALEKVGDFNDSTQLWELRKNFWKDLDVWSFKYDSAEERQSVIDNAVRHYDKMRMGVSEPQWDRLLPKEERGTGKCLSKLQAKIATGNAMPPKINVSQAEGSGRDTPGGNDEDDKGPSRATSGEGASRSTSHPPTTSTKPKKLSEREAQAKRLLSSKPAKTVKATPKTAPKATAASKKKVVAEKEKDKGKSLSSQYIEDSDEEALDSIVVSKPPPKPMKRTREEVEKPIAAASKKTKTTAADHRVSDASQSSRTTNYSSNSFKSKGTSPQKSSPLASSPPKNASDFENDDVSLRRSSASASPYNVPAANKKRKYGSTEPVTHHNSSSNSSTGSTQPVQKRQKSSSVSSTSTSSSTTAPRYGLPRGLTVAQQINELSRRYKVYYPQYLELHAELEYADPPDPVKMHNLTVMRKRLSGYRTEIFTILKSNNIPTTITPGADWRPVTHGGSIDYSDYF